MDETFGFGGATILEAFKGKQGEAFLQRRALNLSSLYSAQTLIMTTKFYLNEV